MMNITGLEGMYLLLPDAVKYQPAVMVVSSSSLAGIRCWKGEETGAGLCNLAGKVGRLERATTSRKY